MVKCCVVACKTKSRGTKDCGVKFHRFPIDIEQRKKWLEAANRKDWEPADHDRICGLHFVTGVKSTNPEHPDFIPTIFPHTSAAKVRALRKRYARFRRRREKSLIKRKLEGSNPQCFDNGWSQEAIDRLLSSEMPQSSKAEAVRLPLPTQLSKPGQILKQAQPVKPGQATHPAVNTDTRYILLTGGNGVDKFLVPLLSGQPRSVPGRSLLHNMKQEVHMCSVLPNSKGCQFDCYIDIAEKEEAVTKDNKEEGKVANTSSGLEVERHGPDTELKGKNSETTALSKNSTVTNNTNTKSDDNIEQNLSERNAEHLLKVQDADKKCDTVNYASVDKDSMDHDYKDKGDGLDESLDPRQSGEIRSGQSAVNQSRSGEMELNDGQNQIASSSSESQSLYSESRSEDLENMSVSEQMEENSSRSSSDFQEIVTLKNLSSTNKDTDSSFSEMLLLQEAEREAQRKLWQEELAKDLEEINASKPVEIEYSPFLDHAYFDTKYKFKFTLNKTFFPSNDVFNNCRNDKCLRFLPFQQTYDAVVLPGEVVRRPAEEKKEIGVQCDWSWENDVQIRRETKRLTLLEETIQLHDSIVKRSYTMNALESNPEKVQFYTGLPNFETIKALFEYVQPHVHCPSEPGPAQFEVLVMTLAKLRLGLRLKDIARQLVLSDSKASQLITSWFDALYCCLTPLIDSPRSSKTKLSFFLDKVDYLKRKYFILERVYDKLYTSDYWVASKGTKDVIMVCEALRQFFIPGPNDNPESTFEDVKDPFELDEPVTDESSSEEEEEEVSEPDLEDMLEDLPSEETAPGPNPEKQQLEADSCNSEDIEQMLDANIGKNMNDIDENMETSLLNSSFSELAATNSGKEEGPSCSWDDLFLSPCDPEKQDSILNKDLSQIEEQPPDVADADTDSETTGVQFSVNSLDQTISSLTSRLHSGVFAQTSPMKKPRTPSRRAKTRGGSASAASSSTVWLDDHSYCRSNNPRPESDPQGPPEFTSDSMQVDHSYL